MIRLHAKKTNGPKGFVEIGDDYFYFLLVLEEEQKFIIKDFKNIYIEKGTEDPEYRSIFREEFKRFYPPEVKKLDLLISPHHAVNCAKLLPLIPGGEVFNYCNQVVTHEMGITNLSYYIDHCVKKLGNKDNMAGMFSGIKKEVLDKVLDICMELHIEVDRIETSLTSIAVLFSQLGLIPARSSIMVIRLQESFTELFILKDRYVVSYNILNFGFRNLKFALVRTIYTHAQPVEIDLEKAEEIVKTLGYPQEDGNYSGISYHQIRILLLPALEILTEKIRTFIQEYKKEIPSENISSIYLMDKAVNIPGLGKYLEDKLSIPYLNFETSELMSNIMVAEDLNIDFSCLNLMLSFTFPGEKRCNFFPPHYRIVKESHRLRKELIAVLVLIVGLFSLLYGGLKLNYFHINKIYARTKEAYDKLLPLIPNVDEVEKMNRELEGFYKKVNEIYSLYPDWVGILKELSNVTPQEIILEDLESGKDDEGNFIFLEGNVVTDIGSLNLVFNQFIQDLENSAYFKEVRIITTKQISSEFINQLNFQLKCYLNEETF